MNTYLSEQIKKYKSFKPQDCIKLLYQSCFGNEHLLSDSSDIAERLDMELSLTPSDDIDLYEYISKDVIRVNLSAYKKLGLKSEYLLKMFLKSFDTAYGRRSDFIDSIKDVTLNFDEYDMPFSINEWNTYIILYLSNGVSSVSHSDEYKAANEPHYRVISAKYVPVLKTMELLARVDSRKPVIAIDGRSTSGKSTFSELLGYVLGVTPVHCDDFYVPFDMRTKERYAVPGANIHYERFEKQVLEKIKKDIPFTYGIYSPHLYCYTGIRKIENRDFIIVEGAYALHPRFGDYADIRIFFDIDFEEQLKRVVKRNGEGFLKKFKEQWIPLEEKYHEAYNTESKCDLVLRNDR